MDLAATQTLTSQVLWAAFALSLVFGAIAQRTHFCTMGAVSDVVNMGDWTRMRMWAMAMGVAMIGFFSLVAAGAIDPAATLYSSNRFIWLSALVGGGMFGFGMVLTSGCGSKTLVRMGGGNLKSLVVFVVMGVAAFATIKGITAVARVRSVDQVFVAFSGPATLPNWIAGLAGLAPEAMGPAVGWAFGSALVIWALSGLSSLQFSRRVDHLVGGIGIGLLIAAMWWVSGHLGFVAEHPQTLEASFLATNSGRAEALSFVAPLAYALDWLMFFSDSGKLLTVGIVSVAGVVLGSAACAIASGTFRWEGFGSVEDTANHLGGAVLMGVGGITAMGCTIGQGLSGISTLSLTSMVAVAAIVAGAVAALKYQMWRLERGN